MTRVARGVLTMLAALSVMGCGILYTDVRVPRAYRSATPADVKANSGDQEVSGQACYYSVLYLVAWGDAGYAAATREALGGDATATLYDVKVDIKGRTVLFGLYNRVCTVVTAKLGRL